MMARRAKSISNYRGWHDMTNAQKHMFRNIWSVLSGGNSVFMHSADPIHQAKLGRVMVAISNMSNWEREQFIKDNWIIFEEVFTNSEAVRSGQGNAEISTEQANAMIDAMWDSIGRYKTAKKATIQRIIK